MLLTASETCRFLVSLEWVFLRRLGFWAGWGARGGAAAEEEAEAVHDDDNGAAFVADNAKGQGNFAGEGKADKEENGSQGDDEVFPDDAAGALAQPEGRE